MSHGKPTVEIDQKSPKNIKESGKEPVLAPIASFIGTNQKTENRQGVDDNNIKN
jgi:hypothetical protein